MPASLRPVLKRTIKTMALDGSNNNGDLDEPTISLFTVTGEVLIVAGPTGRCTETLVSAGGGTLALGVTGSTALFIAATTAADIATNDLWIDATPTDTNGVALPAALKDILITDNIIATVATADITDGTIVFTVWWMPWSEDGRVVAA